MTPHEPVADSHGLIDAKDDEEEREEPLVSHRLPQRVGRPVRFVDIVRRSYCQCFSYIVRTVPA